MTFRIVSRVAALVLITIGGLTYIATQALQLNASSSPYPVDLRIPDSGGLFSGGYVTLRGVDVGRVTSMGVSTSGVVAHLSINHGARIPTNTAVSVRELSAVGEQYVDLVPRTAGGPYLHAHSVLTATSNDLPVTVAQILGDSSGFANSINTPAVNSLLQTLTNALQGTGPELRQLIESATSMTSTLATVQPATNTVIDSGQVLLQTGIQTNPQVNGFSVNLDQLSGQLKASDSALRALVSSGPPDLSSINQLLGSDQAATAGMLNNTAAVAAVVAANGAGTRALLADLPPALQDLASTASSQGIRAVVNFNDKNDICTYPGAHLQDPTSVVPLPLALNRSCPTTAPDLLQRGAANAPEPAP